MATNSKRRNSYLNAVEVTHTYHNLNNDSSKLLAKHNLVDAISGIRGTLPPVKQIGPDFGSGFKWSGGCRAPDGRMFFAPHGAEHVLCLNPFDGTISTYGDPVSSFSNNLNLSTGLQSVGIPVTNSGAVPVRKFSDVVVGPLGLYLYLIPASSRYVLKMEINTGKWEALGADLGGLEWKWGKGVLFGDKIYCSPHNADKVLMIDCGKQRAVLIGESYGNQNAKWGTPVVVPLQLADSDPLRKQYDSAKMLAAPEAVVVFPPLNASRILVLDPRTKQTCLIGDHFGDSLFKYDGACIGSDGAVYCAPSCATQFLRIQVVAKAEIVQENVRSSSVENDKNRKLKQVLGANSSLEDYDEENVEVLFKRDSSCGASVYQNTLELMPWKIGVERLAKQYPNQFPTSSLPMSHGSGADNLNSSFSSHGGKNHGHQSTMSNKLHGLFHHGTKQQRQPKSKVLNSTYSYSASGGGSIQEGDDLKQKSNIDMDDDDNEGAGGIHLVQVTAGGSLHEESIPPANISNMQHSQFRPSPSSPSSLSSSSDSSSPTSKSTQNVSRVAFKWPPKLHCTYHGIERAGNFKFGDMVMSADGMLAIAIPLNAAAFQCIDTCVASITQEEEKKEKAVRRIGPRIISTNLKFGGGVIGLDGYLYCSPLQANQALRMDTLALSQHVLKVNPPHHSGVSDDNRSLKSSATGQGTGAPMKAWNQTVESLFHAYVHKRQFESSPQFEAGKAAAETAAKKGHVLTKTAAKFQSIVKKVEDENMRRKLQEEEEGEEETKQSSYDKRYGVIGDIDSDDEVASHSNHNESFHLKFSTKSLIIAIAAYAHWRKFASVRARERQGYSASDRAIGNRDKAMKALMLKEPEVWCYGLTLENSTIPEDLCDWLAAFSETEVGHDFITTCGRDARMDKIVKVSKLPNLTYSLIVLEKHDLLMKLPIIRKSIMIHHAFEGDWFLKCLLERKLMEKAVDFVETVSEDIHSAHMNKVQILLDKRNGSNSGNDDGDDSDEEDEINSIMKNKTFERIAAIDNFVAPMLRLPMHLQDRIVSTKLVGAVLDELFTERPLAILIIKFDFFNIIALIFVLINATWNVQHTGPLEFEELLVIGILLWFNFVYVIREYINYRSSKKLIFKMRFSKVLDTFNVLTIFALVGMSFSPKIRMSAPFLVVAATTSGTCWLKLLNFLSIIHLKFAVYIEAIKLITKALRFIIFTLLIFMAMFANMFFVVMKSPGNNEDDEDGDGDDDGTGTIYDTTFTRIQTSFLTLFRMLLGDFDFEWFVRDGEKLLTFYAVILFILYMIGVFVILFNVLIAVVCDNYSIALSEAHEIFLRSRLQVVANLDMQGLTKLRNGKHLKQSRSVQSGPGDGSSEQGMDGEGGGDGGMNSGLKQGNSLTLSTGNAYYNGYDNSTTLNPGIALEIIPGVFHNPLELFQKGEDNGINATATGKKNQHKAIHTAAGGMKKAHNTDGRGEQQPQKGNCLSEFFERLADRVDFYLTDSLWHKYMRSFLSIGRDIDFHDSFGKSQQNENDGDDDEEGEGGKRTISMIKKLDHRVLMLEEQQLASEDRIMQHVQTVVNGMEARIVTLCAQLVDNRASLIGGGDGGGGGGGGGGGDDGYQGKDNSDAFISTNRGVPPPPRSLVQAQPGFRLRGPFFDCSI